MIATLTASETLSHSLPSSFQLFLYYAVSDGGGSTPPRHLHPQALFYLHLLLQGMLLLDILNHPLRLPRPRRLSSEAGLRSTISPVRNSYWDCVRQIKGGPQLLKLYETTLQANLWHYELTPIPLILMLLERPRLRILFLLSILRKDHENFRLYIARNAANHIMREMFGGCGLPTGTVLGISELVTEISQLSLAKSYLIAQRLYCEVNGRWKRHTRKRRVVEVHVVRGVTWAVSLSLATYT